MTPKKIIQQGAEATIFLDKKTNIITKKRNSKSYRIKSLDDRINKLRTRSETKILEKVSKIIDVPKLINTDNKENEKDHKIQMEFINGLKLSDYLNEFQLEEQKKVLEQIGINVGKLHEKNIIHGDLTTSNLILKENKVFFVDFGLSFQNGKIEDKAVDIHLLKQALEAKHFQNHEELFKSFLKGYKKSLKEESKKIIERVTAVERRGRYRH